MSIHKKLIKVIQTLFQEGFRLYRALTKTFMNWLLRSFFVMGHRSPGLSQTGFVLPTVVMVLLVVILLTTVIVNRSFDRAKNISNYRVNQEVLNAALPALDRAKAKIEALFADPNLPRGTPTDISIEEVLIRRDPVTKRGKYDLDDETPLELAYDLNGGGGIDAGTSIEDKETSATAWRFPVDTDNNGSFDSFTLYGILFRTPPTDPNGDATRERAPLETRALPMQQGEGSAACASAAGTSASLVGSKGWYKIGSQLKRSVFVYVATVPITDENQANLIAAADDRPYETYRGNKGFSALEYQQDQAKIPLANNAVLYEDDVEIVSGPAFRLNGRVFTNSNLFVTELDNPVVLRQVSSRNSCFYEAVNAKIVIGGNLGYGYTPGITNTNAVQVDLFQGDGTGNDPTTNKEIKAANVSVTESQAEMAYNTEAYERRIDKLVTETIAAGGLASDPSEVQEGVAALSPPASADEARRDQLDRYFRRRTRRVPFKEVPYNPTQTPDQNDPALAGATPQGSGDTLAPPDAWMYPFNPADGKTGAGYSRMTLNTNGDKLYPSASNFDNRKDNDPEQDIGDRVLVGNNLPALRKDGDEWVGAEVPQDIEGFNWDYGGGARQRKTQVELLSDLGDNGRDKFWEQKAAEQPVNLLDGVGGLRLVTGAGVYLPTLATGETLAANASNVVWPDSMPMIPRGATPPTWLANNSFPLDAAGLYRPFLKMRATAVYHFKHEQGKKPIACVSSFYDPTNNETVRNISPLEDVSGAEAGITARPAGASSNNGITYGPPTRDASDPTLNVILQYQAGLVYPNGRLVNEQLKTALANPTPTLAEQAAIDSTICALQIMGVSGGITRSITPTSGYSLPHGTIKEVAFLDPRQVKSIDDGFTPFDAADTTTGFASLTGNYDLAIEQRQPLEVRATEIDLDELRQSTAPDSEYMLPNSGIIYATRDDALPDASDATLRDGSDSNARISATDFKLDPTRRVSAIRLINGKELFRTTDYREVEKGLILASNLPVYIKADAEGEFNPHKNAVGPVSEFSDPAGTPFYDRATLNNNFACRSNDPRLPAGACNDPDTWRQATVISDAVTLLSRGFTDGYRSDGNYELRNNQIDNIASPDTSNDIGSEVPDVLTAKEIRDQRLANGFWDNNFVTSRNFTDQDYAQATPPAPEGNSSYFNNFVTPIQRRVEFPEFLMETCMKRVVSDCTPGDWVINASGQKARQVLGATYDGNANIQAGTTAQAANVALDPTGSYPRRIAFLRQPADNKLLLSNNKPIVMGIRGNGRIGCFTYVGSKTVGSRTCQPYRASNKPRNRPNALWFATTTAFGNPVDTTRINYGYNNPLAYLNDQTDPNQRLRLGPNGTVNQPLLVPVLQIQYPTAVSGGNLATIAEANLSKQTQWLPKAEGNSIFNLVMATGDNPSHPAFGDHEGDFNGGLPNLPRFIENWQGINTEINGSFIQIKRSSYATAPNTQLPNTTETVAPFGNYPQVYTTGNNFGKTPSFEPPERAWGFDVGLLSQLPDLFAKQFTAPPAEKPNEFFREVSREDDWVKTLLCAKTLDGGNVAINDNQRPNDFCDDKTGG